MTVAEPGATPVKAIEQLPVRSKVQLAATVPTVVSEDEKLTLPVGVFEAVVVSVRVAVQVEVPPMPILAGEQTTVVEVLSRVGTVTVTAVEVPELPLCDESPAYVPVTVAEPAATPVKRTEQLPVESNAQLAPTVPTVVSDEVKLTLPVGVFAAFVVSITVTVQVEVVPTGIEEGLQLTLVEVLSKAVTVTVIVAAVLVLPLSVVSPP